MTLFRFLLNCPLKKFDKQGVNNSCLITFQQLKVCLALAPLA